MERVTIKPIFWCLKYLSEGPMNLQLGCQTYLNASLVERG